MVQTRARALDNNMYVIAPNLGTYYLTVDSETPIDTFGGHSLIADHQGRVVVSWPTAAVLLGCGHDRHRRAAPLPLELALGNWMKDLTTEQYRLIYEQDIYPKNLYLDQAPYTHDEYREHVLDPQIRKLQERGIYAPPPNKQRSSASDSPVHSDHGTIPRSARGSSSSMARYSSR